MRGVLCKYNSNSEKKIGFQNYVFCNLKNKWVPIYQCNKGQCREHEFNPVVSVTIPVGRCDECPYHYIHISPDIDSGDDYICKIANKVIASYIEFDSELPVVPEWCPFRSKE